MKIVSGVALTISVRQKFSKGSAAFCRHTVTQENFWWFYVYTTQLSRRQQGRINQDELCLMEEIINECAGIPWTVHVCAARLNVYTMCTDAHAEVRGPGCLSSWLTFHQIFFVQTGCLTGSWGHWCSWGSWWVPISASPAPRHIPLCLGFDMGVREPNLGAHIFMVGTLLSKTPLKPT